MSLPKDPELRLKQIDEALARLKLRAGDFGVHRGFEQGRFFVELIHGKRKWIGRSPYSAKQAMDNAVYELVEQSKRVVTFARPSEEKIDAACKFLGLSALRIEHKELNGLIHCSIRCNATDSMFYGSSDYSQEDAEDAAWLSLVREYEWRSELRKKQDAQEIARDIRLDPLMYDWM